MFVKVIINNPTVLSKNGIVKKNYNYKKIRNPRNKFANQETLSSITLISKCK